jgi:hypothetical protein
VLYKDLVEFQKRRDAERRKGLTDLAKRVTEAGLYFLAREK